MFLKYLGKYQKNIWCRFSSMFHKCLRTYKPNVKLMFAQTLWKHIHKHSHNMMKIFCVSWDADLGVNSYFHSCPLEKSQFIIVLSIETVTAYNVYISLFQMCIFPCPKCVYFLAPNVYIFLPQMCIFPCLGQFCCTKGSAVCRKGNANMFDFTDLWNYQ